VPPSFCAQEHKVVALLAHSLADLPESAPIVAPGVDEAKLGQASAWAAAVSRLRLTARSLARAGGLGGGQPVEDDGLEEASLTIDSGFGLRPWG
jgi:hypothetical protein